MRNLLALLALAALTVVGLGYKLDWYKVQSTPSTEGHQKVNIDINTQKISADVHKGAERGAEKIQELLDKNHSEETAGAAEPKKTDAAKTAPWMPPGFIFEETPQRAGTPQQ